LLDTLSESAVENSGLFRWSAVNRILNEHLDRKANWDDHLWGLLTLVLWMKQWHVEASERNFTVLMRSEEYAEIPLLR
jgi:asparagine synthase (glutamine-hydrolysing)